MTISNPKLACDHDLDACENVDFLGTNTCEGFVTLLIIQNHSKGIQTLFEKFTYTNSPRCSE